MVAETKLYQILNISPSASQDEIKKGYKKAALKYHPDKNKNNPDAAEKFKEASQAYEILSDPEKRKVYDQFGLDFILKGGASQPPPGAGGGGFGGMPGGFSSFGGMPGGTSFHFSSSGRPGGGGGFSFRRPEDLFQEFASANDADDDIFSFLRGGMGGMGMGGMGGMGGPGKSSRVRREPPREPTTIKRDLPVSLEDFAKGAHKKLKITRKVFDLNGQRRSENKVIEFDIKPGQKVGTKFTFPGAGDEEEGGKQNMQFTLTEKPHTTLKRDGDNVRTTVEISLKESLTGWERTLTTVHGTRVTVRGEIPTQPGSEIRQLDAGMPILNSSGRNGDFIIKVSVKFPPLTPDQRARIAQIL